VSFIGRGANRRRQKVRARSAARRFLLAYSCVRFNGNECLAVSFVYLKSMSGVRWAPWATCDSTAAGDYPALPQLSQPL